MFLKLIVKKNYFYVVGIYQEGEWLHLPIPIKYINYGMVFKLICLHSKLLKTCFTLEGFIPIFIIVYMWQVEHVKDKDGTVKKLLRS